MKYFVGLLLVLAVVAGATKVGYDRFEDEIDTRAAVPTGTTLPPVLPAQGQVVVVGRLDNVHVEAGQVPPLAMPLTFSTPDRGGSSGGTFTGVNVDGADSSIHWDAGTPLKLAGQGGSLAVGPVTIDVDGDHTVVTFPDDLPQGITTGTYTIGSPVAVSSGSGLGAPRDTVTFDATAAATITFSGGAAASYATAPLTIKGPGKVVLTGELILVRPDKSQTKVHTVTLDRGPFTVDLTTSGQGLSVTASLQGDVTTA